MPIYHRTFRIVVYDSNMRWFTFLTLMLIFFTIGCQIEQLPQAESEIVQIAAAYTNWPSPMSEPVNQSFGLWLLCRSMTEQEKGYVNSEHGKHETQLFVNDASILPMLEETGERNFPSGTVLVKEKTSDWDWEVGETAERYVAGLGIMIKDGSEWEYAYWTPDGNIATGGETKHCAACHSAFSQTDYVYYPQLIDPFAE